VTSVRVTNVYERMHAIKEVGTLPSVLAHILSLVQDETSTAVELAAEISADQALTLRVLRAVNSGYYGFRRRIAAIPEAVVILGFAEVERLALAISVINLFGHDAKSNRCLRLLWQHSLSCSVAASVLETSSQAPRAELSNAHVAGLLHDIGKVVIAQYFPEALPAIARVRQEEGVDNLDAEREVLDGATHPAIGSWLAEMWELPPSLTHAIALHHAPEQATDHKALAYAAHAANAVTNWLTIRAAKPDTPCHVYAPAAELLGLDDSMVDRIRTQLDNSRGMMGAIAAGAAA